MMSTSRGGGKAPAAAAGTPPDGGRFRFRGNRRERKHAAQLKPQPRTFS